MEEVGSYALTKLDRLEDGANQGVISNDRG